MLKTPTGEATKILMQWNHAFPSTPCIDLKVVADQHSIKIASGSFEENDFQGALIIKQPITAIIYNENIKEPGRKRFTIAHELGHYFLHKDIEKFKCLGVDLENLGETPPHGKEVEAEANEFASALLMPVNDFREQMLGKDFCPNTIRNLAERYQTTVTATASRALRVAPAKQMIGIVMVDDNNQVKWWRRSRNFKAFGFKANATLKLENLGKHAQVINGNGFLSEKSNSAMEFLASAIVMRSYKQRLIFIEANWK